MNRRIKVLFVTALGIVLVCGVLAVVWLGRAFHVWEFSGRAAEMPEVVRLTGLKFPPEVSFRNAYLRNDRGDEILWAKVELPATKTKGFISSNRLSTDNQVAGPWMDGDPKVPWYRPFDGKKNSYYFIRIGDDTHRSAFLSFNSDDPKKTIVHICWRHSFM